MLHAACCSQKHVPIIPYNNKKTVFEVFTPFHLPPPVRRSGANTSSRFVGQTPADVADQAGYPATANLIRMAPAAAPQLPSGQTAAAQRARAGAVRKQLSAADAAMRSAVPAELSRRVASDPADSPGAPAAEDADAAGRARPPSPPKRTWQQQLAALPGSAPAKVAAAGVQQPQLPLRQLSRDRREAARQQLLEQQEAQKAARQAAREEQQQGRQAESQERWQELADWVGQAVAAVPSPPGSPSEAAAGQALADSQARLAQLQTPPSPAANSNTPGSADGIGVGSQADAVAALMLSNLSPALLRIASDEPPNGNGLDDRWVGGWGCVWGGGGHA
jgi:hypothetical protein